MAPGKNQRFGIQSPIPITKSPMTKILIYLKLNFHLQKWGLFLSHTHRWKPHEIYPRKLLQVVKQRYGFVSDKPKGSVAAYSVLGRYEVVGRR